MKDAERHIQDVAEELALALSTATSLDGLVRNRYYSGKCAAYAEAIVLLMNRGDDDATA